MAETLRWWVLASVIGLIATPYTFRLLRFLPDRGYTVARSAGILLTVYPMWLLAVLGLVNFSAGSATLVLAALAVGAVALAGRDRHEFAAHWRAHRGLFVAGELVFALALVLVAVLRAYAPDIEGTEKPFEFAFFNAILRGPSMPPADPWYGGAPMSYYYGGYLVVALFTHLTHVLPSHAFNLGTALTAALTAQAAFGVGANVILVLRQRRYVELGSLRARGAIAAGVFSVALLMLIGNLEGLIELGAAHGWWNAHYYHKFGIENLIGPRTTTHWYPDEFWFWWRATRLGAGWNVLEFPFFSFMLGDLHAHVMALPFALLGVLTAFNVLAAGRHPAAAALMGTNLGQDGQDVGGHLSQGAVIGTDGARVPNPLLEGLRTLTAVPLAALYLALLGGWLALVNTWDFPIFMMLLLFAALLAGVGERGVTWWAAIRAAAFAVPVAIVGVVLYLPYFLDQHSATQGIKPVELNHLPEGVGAEAMVFPPHHVLLFWGPLLVVAGSGLLLQAARRRAWASRRDWPAALALTLLPLLLWSAAIIGGRRSLVAWFEEVGARATRWGFGSYWIVQGVILLLVALGVLTLLIEARRPVIPRRAGRLFLVLLLTTGFMLIHVVELFFVLEPSRNRVNTLFKFSYTAWLLLATAGGAAMVDVALSGRARRPLLQRRPVWTAVTASVLAVALIYPVTATMNRTNGFAGTPTLDGLAAYQRINRDESDATRWLVDTVIGYPIVLEATGGDYSGAGRISARTGFPTVIGWPFHEAQERGAGDYDAATAKVAQMQRDVDTIYASPDPAQALALLRAHNVGYVFLGRAEREKYGEAGMAKWEQIAHTVYRNPSVTIYWVGESGPGLAGAR